MQTHVENKPTLVPIASIKPNPKNPNKHSSEQIERLSELLKYYGWRQPLIVSKQTGLLVVGHGRLEAAKKLKWKQAPVMEQDFESPAVEFGFMVADNAIASWAELDIPQIELDIPGLGEDFNVDLLGLKDFSIEPATEPGCDEDQVPEVKETKVRLGDLWVLGGHRLLCGDSTKKEDVERLMNGEKADMVFTDPPYGVGYVGIHEGIHGAGTHRRKELENDESDELIKQVPSILESSCDGPIYLFCGAGKETGLLNAIEATNLERISVLVWNKPKGSLALNANYKPTFEMFFYLKTNKSDRRWAGSHTEWTVWDIAKEGANKLHPTQKPIELIEKAINNHTAKTVLDPFLGSGSTLIACEKTNRKCYGMEIDPTYCDVIIQRWQKFSGKQARREDGTLYDNL